MKLKTIYREKTINTGNYTSEKIGFEVELEEGETREEVLAAIDEKFEEFKSTLTFQETPKKASGGRRYGGTPEQQSARKEAMDAAVAEVLEKYPDEVQAKREELGENMVDDTAAAMIVAREKGITGVKPTLLIAAVVGDTIDCIATVHKIYDPREVTRKKDGSTVTNQAIIVTDVSGASAKATFWGDDVAKLEGIDEGDTVRFARVKVKDGYDGGSIELSISRASGFSLHEKKVVTTQEML